MRTTLTIDDHFSDAYLAAVAIDLDAELVTADRGFAHAPRSRRPSRKP